MPTKSAFARSRLLWLLLAALVVATAACAGPASSTPAAPAASVQDQLAQLAAGAASQTPTSGSGQSVAAAQATTTPQPAVAATKHPAAGAVATPRPTRRPTATTAPRPAKADGLPTISQAQLPREARETIRLIERGGPFPYDKDGATFGNREGLLPKRPSGYYHEYTVITPGSPDRGARRIIGGQAGELYYTDDHYDSFKRVIP